MANTHHSEFLDLLVVMPAYNEEASLPLILKEVLRVVPNKCVLVVDDGSIDKTTAVAQAEGVPVLTLPFNMGVGGAMRAGFRFAREEGVNNVIQLDSDGQHDPADIPKLLEGLKVSDIVIGARFAGKGNYLVTGPRKWAMSMLSWALSKVCSSELTDTTSGYKAMGPRALELFSRNYPAEYLGDTVEALVLAARAGLTVSQVPVEMRNRYGGEPSHSPLKSAVYLGRAFLALIIGLSKAKSERLS